MRGPLGLLLLDTRFPRLPGDAGRPDAWPMPVLTRVVQGASPQRIVREGDPALLEPFLDAALALVHGGARALTTSCGFLARFQSALQQRLPVPVWTSSLLKLPELERPGVLTVDARALGVDILRAAGADPATPVEGLADGSVLQTALLHNLPTLDADAARADALAAALRLIERHPTITSIVLECTNLPPYAEAIATATGRPVHHLISLVTERWESA